MRLSSVEFLSFWRVMIPHNGQSERPHLTSHRRARSGRLVSGLGYNQADRPRDIQEFLRAPPRQGIIFGRWPLCFAHRLLVPCASRGSSWRFYVL